MSPPPSISLAYSVDADDAFMFHALREQAIDTEGLTFTHRRDHTAALNRLAAAGGTDVVAISVGAYPGIADRYQMLSHGASVGRGFGPVLVAPSPLDARQLAGARIGIPGVTTTAYLVLRLIEPDVMGVEIPISPFGRIFDALAAGEIDAALLIHEGRLLYRERGLHLAVDLGSWWEAETGLPLPLGVNVVRRGLGPDLVARVSRVLKRSIDWAIANRDRVIEAMTHEKRGEKRLQDPELLDQYLKLYANEDTAALADDARRAIDRLFERARGAGLIPNAISIDWAP